MRKFAILPIMVGFALFGWTAASNAAGTEGSSSGGLVPGGWLQRAIVRQAAPVPQPEASPATQSAQPAAAGPAAQPAAPARPRVVHRAKQHPQAPARGAPPSDGKIQF